MASASAKGEQRRGDQGSGRQAGKKTYAADWSTAKRVSVREEHIWELQKILDGQKGSLRKTYKSQREAHDNVWFLIPETEKGVGGAAFPL